MTRPLRLRQTTIGRLQRAADHVRAYQRYDNVDPETLKRVLIAAQGELLEVLVDIDFVLSAKPEK